MTKNDERLFVKMSLDILSHPKLLGAAHASKWLYFASIVVSRRELSDGIVRPGVALAEAEATKRHEKDLIARGLWHQPGHDCDRCEQPPKGTVAVHDYLLHNNSKAEVEKNREVRSAAGRRGAAVRWNGTDSKTHGKSHANANGEHDAKSMLEREGERELLVQSVPQPTDPAGEPGLTDEDFTKIEQRLRCDRSHARRVADIVLAKAQDTVRNPRRYILKAIDDAPADYRPTMSGPTKDQVCPKSGHSGFAGTCIQCASEAKAVPKVAS